MQLLRELCDDASTKADLAFVEVKCVVGDASQSHTFANIVQAPPEEADWNKWVSEPKRILTMTSRTYRTIAVPQLSGDSGSVHQGAQPWKDPNAASLRAMHRIANQADLIYEWQDIEKNLSIKEKLRRVWSQWIQQIEVFKEVTNIKAPAESRSDALAHI